MEDKDVQTILALIINHQEVNQYFHSELKERVPLIIVTNGKVPDGLKLDIFGENVVFTNTVNTDKPYLEVKSFSNTGPKVEFSMNYPIEGVSIEGTCLKTGEKWDITDLEVYEN